MTKKATVWELHEQGLGTNEIVEKTGFNKSCVQNYINQKKKAEQTGRRCSTCQYRSSSQNNLCDYMLITGKRRGCKSETCDKYVRGDRLKEKGEDEWRD